MLVQTCWCKHGTVCPPIAHERGLSRTGSEVGTWLVGAGYHSSALVVGFSSGFLRLYGIKAQPAEFKAWNLQGRQQERFVVARHKVIR